MSENSSQNDRNIEQYAQYMPDYSYVDPYQYRVGFGRRFLALIIDNMVLTLLLMLYMILSGTIHDFSAIAASGTMDLMELIEMSNQFKLPVILISLLYFSSEIFLALSLGKLTLGVRIASENATKANYQTLIIRFIIKHILNISSLLILVSGFWFLGIIGTLLGLVVYVGFLFVLGQKRQGFHDMLAKSAVFFKEDIKQN